jgi:hypothetical protein
MLEPDLLSVFVSSAVSAARNLGQEIQDLGSVIRKLVVDCTHTILQMVCISMMCGKWCCATILQEVIRQAIS